MNFDNGILQIGTSEIGARISFSQKDGKCFIFPQQTVGKKNKDIIRGGMHLCSPIFGKKNGKFDVIPQHGGLRDAIWQINNSSKDYGVKYEYELKIDDYWLVYNICYRLLRNCLQVVTTVENKLDTPAPFELGWHPYFFAPNGVDISLNNSGEISIYIDKYDSQYGPKIFPDNKIIEIELHGIGSVNLLLGEKFANKQVCIWTDSRQYICVEPLLSHPDDFNTENGFFLEQDKPLATDFIMCFR